MTIVPLLAATSDATNNLYVLTAFGAGIISFLSPCVLPIVPAYLSLVTGLSIGEIQSDDKQTTVLARITLDTEPVRARVHDRVRAPRAGHDRDRRPLFENQDTLTRISGGLVLLMAIYLAGSQLLTTPRLYQEFRFHPHLERFGPVAAPIAGVAFGLGLDAVHRSGARHRPQLRGAGPGPRPRRRPADGVLARSRPVVPRGRAVLRPAHRAARLGEAPLDVRSRSCRRRCSRSSASSSCSTTCCTGHRPAQRRDGLTRPAQPRRDRLTARSGPPGPATDPPPTPPGCDRNPPPRWGKRQNPGCRGVPGDRRSAHGDAGHLTTLGVVVGGREVQRRAARPRWRRRRR